MQSALAKFHPQSKELALNTDTNLLKLVAVITMLIDHMGAVLFPRLYFLRIIGRIAFPLFCWCIVVGSVYTKSMSKYMLRMLLLFLVSQPVYASAMGHSILKPNIMLTLMAALLIIWTLRCGRYYLTPFALAIAYFLYPYVDYGYYGILLILLMYLFRGYRVLSLLAVGGFMLATQMGGSYHIWGMSLRTQAFALFALPLIYIRTNTGIKLHKYVFYAFYPLHLDLILGLSMLARKMGWF